MKEFTPPGLHLLGPSSMAWASLLAQYGKNVVYKDLLLLKPIPMCSECQNKLGTLFPELNLVEKCSSYDSNCISLEILL